MICKKRCEMSLGEFAADRCGRTATSRSERPDASAPGGLQPRQPWTGSVAAPRPTPFRPSPQTSTANLTPTSRAIPALQSHHRALQSRHRASQIGDRALQFRNPALQTCYRTPETSYGTPRTRFRTTQERFRGVGAQLFCQVVRLQRSDIPMCPSDVPLHRSVIPLRRSVIPLHRSETVSYCQVVRLQSLKELRLDRIPHLFSRNGIS